MPLKPGRSKSVVSENIREFHKGRTYRRTQRRKGKRRADRQAVAVAMRASGMPRYAPPQMTMRRKRMM